MTPLEYMLNAVFWLAYGWISVTVVARGVEVNGWRRRG